MNQRIQVRESIFVALMVALMGLPLTAIGTEQRVASASAADASNSVSVDDTIAFYENKVQQHPSLFAGFAALGSAYLDKARDTHDTAWLAKARNATARSLELQPNLIALTTMAAICNFSHRFACGLEYAQRAARARPGDESLLPLLVEAQLGLGELESADGLITRQAGNAAAQLSMLAARARWFAEQQRFDEAHQAFAAAAAQARKSGADDLVIWAETNAAGMLIDSNRPAPARAHLESASALQTHSQPVAIVLQVHWAELHDLEGRSAQALAIYESILVQQQDPEMYRRAFVLASKTGDAQRAARLLADGERAAERILAAGEIFAVESQARLYADAGIKLERAQQLAQQNLLHKRDRSARETLEYVQQQIQNRAAANH